MDQLNAVPSRKASACRLSRSFPRSRWTYNLLRIYAMVDEVLDIRCETAQG
jgi:hypothetical protein